MIPYAPTHHILDINPVPSSVVPSSVDPSSVDPSSVIPSSVTFVNEPDLIDTTIPATNEIDAAPDNIRIYVPMDINKDAIMRRLHNLIFRYGEANEQNESNFSCDVEQLVYQIEIYDQIWTGREMKRSIVNSQGRRHSAKAQELVRAFVKALEEIPDGCSESFPFELIDNLRGEYL